MTRVSSLLMFGSFERGKVRFMSGSRWKGLGKIKDCNWLMMVGLVGRSLG